MPWNECQEMDEKLQFVARYLEGEKIAALCREFGISRKTGYKIFDRYQECGIHEAHGQKAGALSPDTTKRVLRIIRSQAQAFMRRTPCLTGHRAV